jgi:hypothetical protein
MDLTRVQLMAELLIHGRVLGALLVFERTFAHSGFALGGTSECNGGDITIELKFRIAPRRNWTAVIVIPDTVGEVLGSANPFWHGPSTPGHQWLGLRPAEPS